MWEKVINYLARRRDVDFSGNDRFMGGMSQVDEPVFLYVEDRNIYRAVEKAFACLAASKGIKKERTEGSLKYSAIWDGVPGMHFTRKRTKRK